MFNLTDTRMEKLIDLLSIIMNMDMGALHMNSSVINCINNMGYSLRNGVSQIVKISMFVDHGSPKDVVEYLRAEGYIYDTHLSTEYFSAMMRTVDINEDGSWSFMMNAQMINVLHDMGYKDVNIAADQKVEFDTTEGRFTTKDQLLYWYNKGIIA